MLYFTQNIVSQNCPFKYYLEMIKYWNQYRKQWENICNNFCLIISDCNMEKLSSCAVISSMIFINYGCEAPHFTCHSFYLSPSLSLLNWSTRMHLNVGPTFPPSTISSRTPPTQRSTLAGCPYSSSNFRLVKKKLYFFRKTSFFSTFVIWSWE